MIRLFSGPLFLLLLVAVPATRGHAEAARGAAFEGLDSIRISTTVAGPLDLEGGTTPKLFAGEVKRYNSFTMNLTNALAVKLDSCGILVSEESSDEVSVEVFGRLEGVQQCTPRYVYLIQAKVLKSQRRSRQPEAEVVSLRPIIGVADEAGLERALIEAAVAAIADELQGCRG